MPTSSAIRDRWPSDQWHHVCPKDYHSYGDGIKVGRVVDASTPILEEPFRVMVLDIDTGWPIGVECLECRAEFEEGDVVLAGQKRLVGWLGWHTRCLKGILDDSPLDEFEITKQKLLNGEDPFE